MNERIRELAGQALDQAVPETWTTLTPVQLAKFQTKFAELIVQACAAEADQQTIYCRGIPWGKWIKQHFGVEE